MAFSYNPGPTGGVGPFGAVPGPVGIPNPAEDLAANYPNLTGTNATVSGNILNELQGQLSPATLRALQTTAAQHGVASGMPGLQPGSMNLNSLFGNIAGYTEDLQRKGVQDYNATIPTISRTQTVSPETQIALAEQNALNRAAPDPTQAATYAMQFFDRYLSKLGSGSKGGGGVSVIRLPGVGGSSGSGSVITGLTPGDPGPNIGGGKGENPSGLRVPDDYLQTITPVDGGSPVNIPEFDPSEDFYF